MCSENFGVQEMYFAAVGWAKRGGARVIYYYRDEAMPIHALLAYVKPTKTDLTPEEKRTVFVLTDALKAAGKGRK